MSERVNHRLPRVLLSLIATLVLAFVIGYIGVSVFGGEPIGIEKASAEQSAANDRSKIGVVEPKYGDSPYIKDIAYTAAVDANDFWNSYFSYYGYDYWNVQAIDYVCNHPRGSHYETGTGIINYDTCSGNNNYGDGAIAAITMHEVGHHIQNYIGLYSGAYGYLTVHKELQADCLAGVAFAQEWYQGMLDGDDLEQAQAWFYDAGDDLDWHDMDHHGTGEQRLEMFNLGWNTEDPTECAAALNL